VYIITMKIEGDKESSSYDSEANKKSHEGKEFFIKSNYATLLENESDLDIVLAKRLKPRVNISVNGLKLSAEAADKLQDEVNNIVARRLERPTQTTVQTDSVSRLPPKRDKVDKIEISSNIYGLTKQDNDEIWQEVEDLVYRFQDEGQIGVVTGSGSLSSIVHCVWVNAPQPTDQPGVIPDWRKVNQPLPQTYALNWDEDILTLKVKERPELPLDEVVVKLQAAWPQITWAKAIKAWNFRGTVVDRILVNSGGIGRGPVEMKVRIGCNDANTLIFEKAKLFGICTDMYTLRIDGVPTANQSYEFAQAFGKKELHFTWVHDDTPTFA
jgi:hypothetical protein